MRIWTRIRQCVPDGLRKRPQSRWIWNRETSPQSQLQEPDWFDFHCREQAAYELMAYCVGAGYEWMPFEPERYGSYYGSL
jgi:hypothetical protein